jgi:hypothetical protein
MDNKMLIGLILVLALTGAGCSKIEGSEIYNWFSSKSTQYYANCTWNNDINLSLNYCTGAKRSVFTTFNSTWNSMCCGFDTRCLAQSNANISAICNNLNATYTYIGPMNTGTATGAMCCNGMSQCYIDFTSTISCNQNSTDMITIASTQFNLTNTSEWDAMCCIG